MTRTTQRLVGVGATLLACSVLVAPAASASAADEPDDVTTSNFRAELAGSDLAKWDSLTPAQQQKAVAALNEVADSDAPPVTDADAKAIAPELSVSSGSSTVAVEAAAPTATKGLARTMAAAAATYEVHSNYWKKFTVLGVTYTRADLDYYYTTGSGKVLADHACVGKVSDHIPLRTITNVNNHWVAAGKGNCIVTWNVKRADGWDGTVITDQGMVVNGSKVEKTWGPQ